MPLQKVVSSIDLPGHSMGMSRQRFSYNVPAVMGPNTTWIEEQHRNMQLQAQPVRTVVIVWTYIHSVPTTRTHFHIIPT